VLYIATAPMTFKLGAARIVAPRMAGIGRERGVRGGRGELLFGVES
jgi:hypothetical protein